MDMLYYKVWDKNDDGSTVLIVDERDSQSRGEWQTAQEAIDLAKEKKRLYPHMEFLAVEHYMRASKVIYDTSLPDWTPEELEMRGWIDRADIQQLLSKWRFDASGDPFFAGKVGLHFSEVMGKKRDADPEAYTAASKSIGWKR
jgi:hypothetical protein